MLEVRGLEPPEPMERVLGALSTLGPNEQFVGLWSLSPYALVPQTVTVVDFQAPMTRLFVGE